MMSVLIINQKIRRLPFIQYLIDRFGFPWRLTNPGQQKQSYLFTELSTNDTPI